MARRLRIEAAVTVGIAVAALIGGCATSGGSAGPPPTVAQTTVTRVLTVPATKAAPAISEPIGAVPGLTIVVSDPGVRIVQVTPVPVKPTPMPTPAPPPEAERLGRPAGDDGVLESGFLELGMVTSPVECVDPDFAQFDSTAGKILLGIRAESEEGCQEELDRLVALKAPLGTIKARYWQTDTDRRGRLVFEAGSSGSYISAAGLWRLPG